MTHPTPEQITEFAYRELPPAETKVVGDHLQICEACRALAESTRETMQALDRWQVRPRARAAASTGNGWKWAAAAAIAISTAFAAGRVSNPGVDPKQLASEVEASVRLNVDREVAARFAVATEQIKTSLRQEMETVTAAAVTRAETRSMEQLKALSAELAVFREEERKGLFVTLKEMESKRAEELLLLRRDLETVAMQAEASLRQAQRQLVHLAGFTTDRPATE